MDIHVMLPCYHNIVISAILLYNIMYNYKSKITVYFIIYIF